jgi:serine/threonine protein phosphatase PrpC
MNLALNYAAKSDVGLVRPGNEDSGYAGPTLLLVADGMGGHAAGELASAMAVATIAQLDVNPPDADDVLPSLADSVDEIGDSIATVIDGEPELTGMGTTVTGLYWLGTRFALVHVGDSRAYVLRDGQLFQMTHDHTYVQTLVDSGSITAEEAAYHPRRSLLMRALDGMNPVEADISLREARVGDRYLLCSDGLTGVVKDNEIEALLMEGEPTGCVTRLVDRALERGAPDNVTVVVADVVDQPEALDGMPDPKISRVVVGAAGEPRVRLRLPHVRFPDDAQPDPDRPDTPLPIDSGPPTAPQPLIDPNVELAVAPRTPHERRRPKWIVGVLAAIVIVIAVAGSLAFARSWVLDQWYVAINGSPGTGTVAIYNGIPGALGGLALQKLNADSQVIVGALPLFDQELVSKGIPAESQADAQRILDELAARAAACQGLFPPAGCPGALE